MILNSLLSNFKDFLTRAKMRIEEISVKLHLLELLASFAYTLYATGSLTDCFFTFVCLTPSF